MKNYDVRHILIDDESSVDVLYYDALMKKEISPHWLTLLDSSFVGFTGDAILVEGMISLPMRMGCYSLWSIVQVDFLIIWAFSDYNIILRRPDLNAF